MSWVLEHLHRDGSVLARVMVTAAEIKIGRALDNDLVLDDPHCAAHHARLDIGADGSAQLVDLGSINGIVKGRNTRAKFHHVSDATTYRIGNALIRVRSSDWAIAPEVSLSRRAMWPYGLFALALLLGDGAWDLWLKDVAENAPKYFYDLSAQAAVVCVWSAAYALFGRLVTGVERFFSHLLIASLGYLGGVIAYNFLELLAFSSSWLWPVQITQPVIVIVVATTVRFHLRLADPRHWPTLRVAVALVAACAIIIPVAQKWVSHDRMTDVQTLESIHHPAWRLAAPITIQEFAATANALKTRVDAARKKSVGEADGYEPNYDYDQ